jgi:hypothetical protein
MTQIQKKLGRRRMKWMMATIRRPIDHHENMKNRKDPMSKSHYSTRARMGQCGCAGKSIFLQFGSFEWPGAFLTV